jgi:hypothetical protein
MKIFMLCAALLLCGAFAAADNPARFFDWSLFWGGSWEESSSAKNDGNGTLYNRGEIKVSYLPAALVLRGGILDRRPFNIGVLGMAPDLTPAEFKEKFFGDPEKQITNLTAGLYHKPTGSRLLFGVLDEWGLPARIRNPWIRSAPYAENRDRTIADIKTAASSTKEDEAYLYMASPLLNVYDNINMTGFFSAQTNTEKLSPSFAGGIELELPKKTELLLETFYTQAVLPPVKSKSWFSASPPLPEREFRLNAASFFFSSPDFSASGDFACSETFALGTDIYGSLGICITPLFPSLKRRPLSFSLAADGAGERFVYRDGVSHGAGFRSAGKIEWKGRRNALLRFDTVLRADGFGEGFNRFSSEIYYRHQARNAASSPIRLTRTSFSADRNAVNPQKISDTLSGYAGISILYPEMTVTGPLGVNFSGSVRRISSVFDSAGVSAEFTLMNINILPFNFQLISKFGYTTYAEKDEKWDFSASAAVRTKHGRFSIKADSPDLSSLDAEKWIWTVSWRLEKR